MKVAIIGYGRMGMEIQEMLLERGHQIVSIIDNESEWNEAAKALKSADIAIEFSMPETARDNILRCFEAGLAVVSGTTGWTDELEFVKQFCQDSGNAFFYASNYSPGMNITFEINKRLAQLAGKYAPYKLSIEETHHKGKKDAPSGTAISLANDIINLHPIKKKWVNKPTDIENEIEIISVRKDKVPGTHLVKYESDIDSLEIRHTAHSRKGFALGAVMAAEWLIGKKGCFSMTDLLNDNE